MNKIVGHCPKCGAPIYVPFMWHGITPPEAMYSCACVSYRNTSVFSTSSTEEEQIEIERKEDKKE